MSNDNKHIQVCPAATARRAILAIVGRKADQDHTARRAAMVPKDPQVIRARVAQTLLGGAVNRAIPDVLANQVCPDRRAGRARLDGRVMWDRRYVRV